VTNDAKMVGRAIEAHQRGQTQTGAAARLRVELDGVVIADTKLEFGLAPDGSIILADEVLTPDSSRFWAADQWQPGQPQHSLDKQFVRDWSAIARLIACRIHQVA